jgi:predicted permease
MLPEARYADAAAITRFYDRLRLSAAELPAVQSAALVSVVPLSGSSASVSVFSAEQFAENQPPLPANLRIASTGYFGAMRIPILAGRDIGPRDEALTPPIVVINEALAGQLWPGTALRDVIGRRINTLSPKRDEPAWWTVVGVAGDIRDEALRADVKPEFYIPVGQVPAMIWPLIQRSLVLVTRARNEGVPPETLERSIRAVVSGVDANLPVADFQSMPALLRASNATARFNLMVLGALGGIALVLAIVGVYGVVSYFVSQRTQEIAVRIALGATPLGIWKHVASRGLLPLGAGLIVGALLAVSTSGMLEAQLYHVSKTDPLTIAATGALLLITSIVATYVPAKRAIRVQPAAALNS